MFLQGTVLLPISLSCPRVHLYIHSNEVLLNHCTTLALMRHHSGNVSRKVRSNDSARHCLSGFDVLFDHESLSMNVEGYKEYYDNDDLD